MKQMLLWLAAGLLVLAASSSVLAGEKSSDAEIREKLLGYWRSPRHSYLIEADGVIYMCPRSICTTTNRWDVKDGLFYWDSEPCEILKLTGKTFVYREVGADGAGYKLERITKEEAE